MIYDEEDVLALSLDHIRVEISVWVRDLRFGFVRNRHVWLLLDDGTRVTVLVESV